ncbi:MAG: hypothetical protein WDN06_15070 [Asticcacaulis sp.]
MGEDKGIGAKAARQRVVACTADQDVGAGVTDNDVVIVIASAVDITRAGQGQAFDETTEREAGGRIDLVTTTGGTIFDRLS